MKKVILTVDKLTIPTYPEPPAEEMPMFAENRVHQRTSGRPYPNKVVMEVRRDHKEEKTYTVVRLENDYVKLEILPEIGGRIYSAYDKTTGYDYFYKQHVIGNLRASGVPSGFSLRKNGESRPTVKHLCRILPEQNEVVLRFEVPYEELSDYELWYGYGNDFYCNITDEGNRAIPAMGPIYIRTDEK